MARLPAIAILAAVLALGGCGYSDNIFSPTAAAATPAAVPAAAARKPFVVIRFARPDPDYRMALYDALRGALERRPDVEFDVVAVTRDPDAAQRDLASVVHSLAAMGMPAERISLSSVAAAAGAADEVLIYLR